MILARLAALRPGRRGTILLILSAIDFAYGLSLVNPSEESLATTSARWREHYAPTGVWGLAWITVGAILLAWAFRRRDAVGYTAAIIWKVVWGLTTLASWLFGGVDRGWVATFIWFTFALMVWVISGWPEPARFPLRETPGAAPGDGGGPAGIVPPSLIIPPPGEDAT